MNTQAELEYYRSKYKDEARKNDGKKIYRYKEQAWRLPLMIRKGDSVLTKYDTYEVIGYQKPLKGDLYLSGAIVEYYKAPNDLNSEYLVIQLDEK
jgi:hypothetical protein